MSDFLKSLEGFVSDKQVTNDEINAATKIIRKRMVELRDVPIKGKCLVCNFEIEYVPVPTHRGPDGDLWHQQIKYNFRKGIKIQGGRKATINRLSLSTAIMYLCEACIIKACEKRTEYLKGYK